MTRTETLKILAVLQAAYPSFYRGQDAEPAVALWAECFADDPYPAVSAAVKALIVSRVEGCPPSIGAVKEKLRLVTKEEPLSEQEAWALVSKACANGIYRYREEFAELPEEVRAAVGTPEQLRAWAMMDADTVQSVVASNFMRTFRAKEKRRDELSALPGDVRQALLGFAKTFALPERGKP